MYVRGWGGGGYEYIPTCCQVVHVGQWPFSPRTPTGDPSSNLVGDSLSNVACNSFRISVVLIPWSNIIKNVNKHDIASCCVKGIINNEWRICTQDSSELVEKGGKTCKLRDSSPATLSIGEDEVDKLLVFFGCPWPLLQPDFNAARLSSHRSRPMIYWFKEEAKQSWRRAERK